MDMNEGLKVSLGDRLGMTGGQLAQQVHVQDGIPSMPLLGLPVRRLVPQDVHSVMDYAGGLSLLAAGLLTSHPAAKATAFALGGGIIGTSLLTDYRLSLAKVVPIEVHEASDYAVGLAAAILPTALGYRSSRTARLASWIQVAVGLSTIAASLFTDYRAVRGRGRGLDV